MIVPHFPSWAICRHDNRPILTWACTKNTEVKSLISTLVSMIMSIICSTDSLMLLKLFVPFVIRKSYNQLENTCTICAMLSIKGIKQQSRFVSVGKSAVQGIIPLEIKTFTVPHTQHHLDSDGSNINLSFGWLKMPVVMSSHLLVSH